MVEARNRNNFIPDETFVEQQITKLPPATDLNTFAVELGPDQRVGDEMPDDFSCPLCYSVAWQPKQCSTCEKYYCTSCIDGWLARNHSCPSCRAEFQSARVQRAALNYFHSSLFKCKNAGCNTTFKYLDAATHLADHQEAFYRCVLNCGDQNTFKGHNGIRAHLTDSCTKAQLKCANCNATKERASMQEDNHICDIEVMKTRIAQMKDTVTKQQETFQQQTATLQSQELMIQQLQQQVQQLVSTSQQQAAIMKQMQETIAKLQVKPQVPESPKKAEVINNNQKGCAIVNGQIIKSKLKLDAGIPYKTCYMCKENVYCRYKCPSSCNYICQKCYNDLPSQ